MTTQDKLADALRAIRDHARDGFPSAAWIASTADFALAEHDAQPAPAPVQVDGAGELPWNAPQLRDWSIVGMNHYSINGQRRLFVSMAKDGQCIKAEGADENSVFQELAAIAALRQPAGWRPIETAPKDGTWVLIRGQNAVRRPMVPIVAAFRPPGCLHIGWVDSGSFRHVDQFAIEWAPLPPRTALASQQESRNAD